MCVKTPTWATWGNANPPVVKAIIKLNIFKKQITTLNSPRDKTLKTEIKLNNQSVVPYPCGLVGAHLNPREMCSVTVPIQKPVSQQFCKASFERVPIDAVCAWCWINSWYPHAWGCACCVVFCSTSLTWAWPKGRCWCCERHPVWFRCRRSRLPTTSITINQYNLDQWSAIPSMFSTFYLWFVAGNRRQS